GRSPRREGSTPARSRRALHPQTKRAPSEARANRWSDLRQDRHQHSDLHQVAKQEWQRAEPRGGGEVARENRELGETTEVDEHEAGDDRNCSTGPLSSAN